MTLEAGFIALFDRRRASFGKTNQTFKFFTLRIRVSLPGAMAGLTHQLF